MTNRERAQAMKALYARLPRVKCQRKCWDHCGVMLPTDIEYQTIEGERHLPLSIRPHKLMGGLSACTMLGTDGRCMVYDIRPFICRAWGAFPECPCPHGCEVENPVPEGRFWEMMREATEIGGDTRAKLLLPYVHALVNAAKAAARREEEDEAA